MNKLTHEDLMTLERYARERNDFRAKALAHKRLRTLHVGDHVTLLFEDRLTVQYQVQEMLRIERIFEPDAIDEELDAYNPLIPDGSNLKATMLIEYTDVDERRRALERLRGIEDAITLVVGDEISTAIADEDLDRSNETKTSAVHFVRFELTPSMIAALRSGAPATFAIDHANYKARADLPSTLRDTLIADLD